MRFNWYYRRVGAHTHVRCFINGAKAGELTFTHEEFDNIRACCKQELNPVTMFCKDNNDQLEQQYK